MRMNSLKVVENVLVIDDSDLDISITTHVIKQSQFTKNIIIRKSTLSALDYLKNIAYGDHPIPEYIFLDLNMPLLDAYDFLDVFKELGEEITSQCKVVVLSAQPSQLDINKLNENKYVSQFVAKPLSPESLSKLISLN